MGRPRQYASAAERQRAYRERFEAEMVRVNRRSLERLEAHLEALHQAVRAASQAGEPVAQACAAVSIDGMLAELTRHFEGKAKRRDAES